MAACRRGSDAPRAKPPADLRRQPVSPPSRGRGRRGGPDGRWSVHPTSKRIDVPASDAADACERRNESTHRSRPCRAAVRDTPPCHVLLEGARGHPGGDRRRRPSRRCSTWRSRRRRRTSSGWCGSSPIYPMTRRIATVNVAVAMTVPTLHRMSRVSRFARSPCGHRRSASRAACPGRKLPCVPRRSAAKAACPGRRSRRAPRRGRPGTGRTYRGRPDRRLGGCWARATPPAASCRATASVWYVFRCRPRHFFAPACIFPLTTRGGGGLVRNRQRTRNSPQAVCGGAGPPPRAGTVVFALREPSASPASRTSP